MNTAAVIDDLRRAESLLEIDRLEAAREILARILAEQPDLYEAQCLAARANMAPGRYSMMLLHAEAAIAVEPGMDWAHRLRAIALRHSLQYDASVAAARTAVRIAPDAWQSHTTLTDSLLMFTTTAELREAHDAAKRARELAPEQPSAHITMARVYSAVADHRRARECQQTALSLDPENTIARHNLAVNQLAQGKLAAAGRQLASVIAANPHHPLFQHNTSVAANVWVWRRADHAAFAWAAAAVLALRWPGSLADHVGAAVLAAVQVIGLVTAYRRLPAGMRHLVRAAPSRHAKRRILAYGCVAAPTSALVLHAVAMNPVITGIAGAAAVPAFGCVIFAAARLRSRAVAAVIGFFRRWRFRLFVLR
ncbi:tetratricopeptide (TPR) repeat protein [Allocatelliglobosispora scoriae]|uniref:Tetratricopeptide (TPR) repeat protein n=1 Tax=Allocatelliglobosispora scoriae TaxID=643052 RepID=A0A841BKT6_9ACTN|nr:hypothetical protein [Allocatelliglobosispora scoriae]MBB5867809.1 tetratricopeptide (TPR) repeat protein [Allocatelliglobosispora scoriae]